MLASYAGIFLAHHTILPNVGCMGKECVMKPKKHLQGGLLLCSCIDHTWIRHKIILLSVL